MMRRAPNANATQEVRVEDVLSSTEARSVNQTQEVRGVDILEEFPLDVPAKRARPAARLQSRQERHQEPRQEARADSRDETPSIAPFEVDIEMPVMSWPTMDARRAESTFDIEAPPPPPRRLRMIVAGAMVFSGLILGGAALRTVITAGESSDAPRTAATQVFVRMTPATVTHAAAPSIVQPAIPSAPLAGTIDVGSHPRAITVDGKHLTPTTSVIVPCGEHVVRIGKDKAQTIDVPCGGTYVVKRAGKSR